MQDMGVPLASNQVQYSLLYRTPERNGVAQACKDAGTTLVAYSPLSQVCAPSVVYLCSLLMHAAAQSLDSWRMLVEAPVGHASFVTMHHPTSSDTPPMACMAHTAPFHRYVLPLHACGCLIALQHVHGASMTIRI